VKVGSKRTRFDNGGESSKAAKRSRSFSFKLTTLPTPSQRIRPLAYPCPQMLLDVLNQIGIEPDEHRRSATVGPEPGLVLVVNIDAIEVADQRSDGFSMPLA
jgi:hypothetical protein